MRTRTYRLTLAAASAAVVLPLIAAARPPGEPAAGAPDRPAAQAAAPMQSTTGNWVVKWQPDNYANAISSLRTALKFRSGYTYTKLNELLLAANRTATQRCPRARSRQDNGALYDGVNPVNWFCLQDAAPNSDARTTRWMPQGVSGTSDAQQGGTVDGSRAFAFTWHHSGDSRSRVTFLNEEPQAGTSPQYRHVLFVRPVMKGGKPDWENVATHAGGLLWYHDYLLVADRATGLLVFDMRNLWDMQQSSAWDRSATHFGRRSDGTYGTYGYRYVLPLIGQWQTQLPNGGNLAPRCTSNKKSQPCYDYTGLDRSTSPPTMLTGEFCNGNPDSSGCPGQTARWTMETGNCTNGCLKHDASGVARATAVYTQPGPYIQGGVSWNGVYYFTASNTRHALGTLYVDRPNVAPLRYQAGVGVQDLYWLRTNNRQLWSLTEFPGRYRRTLYGVSAP